MPRNTTKEMAKSSSPDDHGRQGKHQAGKIDLGDHVLLVHHHAGGVLQRAGKVHPGKQGAVVKDGIRQPVRIHLGQFAEEKAEHHHGHEGLNHRPGRADGGLLVANLDVAPDEEIEQLARRPKLLEIDVQPPARRSDPQHRRLNRNSLLGEFVCHFVLSPLLAAACNWRTSSCSIWCIRAPRFSK